MPKRVMVVADCGSSHLGNRVRAEQLIMESKIAGASYIKFQLFKHIPPNIPLPYEYWKELVAYANEIGIGIFASVWDKEGVDLIKDTSRYCKIAYNQRHNWELLKYAFNNCETLIVSGDDSTDFLYGKKLFCVPEYPSDPKKYENVDYSYYSGISDHTTGWETAVKAVKKGARIVEKHICLTKESNDPDSKGKHSLTPRDFKIMVEEIKKV